MNKQLSSNYVRRFLFYDTNIEKSKLETIKIRDS